MRTRTVLALLAFMVVAAVAQPAAAVNFSFTGNFADDDDVQLFNFSVGAPSTVTLRTWSYAGGTNAAGATIAGGGFDPILHLFDGSGNLIDYNDDGGNLLVPQDSVTGNFWDTYFQSALGAGNYTVAVSQYDNFLNSTTPGTNISVGFARTGQPTFTGTLTGHPGEMFWDVSGNQRDSHWAFDILDVAQTNVVATPLPGTLVLTLAALGLLATGRRIAGRV